MLFAETSIEVFGYLFRVNNKGLINSILNIHYGRIFIDTETYLFNLLEQEICLRH